MTNEEKARETYPYYEDMMNIEIVQTNAKRVGFIAGCEWLTENVSKHCHGHYTFLKGLMLEEFRQAMEGGEE
ncbi:MAG: hypothetical protein E7073_06780 [Bacteroidales bacterium]|nr:hypothetical protein [Bacteroidales bacterium]